MGAVGWVWGYFSGISRTQWCLWVYGLLCRMTEGTAKTKGSGGHKEDTGKKPISMITNKNYFMSMC